MSNLTTKNVATSMDTAKLLVSVLIAIASVAGFYIYAEYAMAYRVVGLISGMAVAIAIAFWTALGHETWEFFRGAQIEVRKVVWPTKQETMQTTLIVVLVVIIVAIILWLLDMFLGWTVGSLMGQRG